MTFPQMMEIVRRKDNTISPVEVAINLNMYYKDICNEVEPMFDVVEITSDGSKVEYGLDEIDEKVPKRYMKLHSIEINGIPLRQFKQSVSGDEVYNPIIEGFQIGINDGDKIIALPADTKVNFGYYSYPPDVTISTVDLPLQWTHPMLLWRVKADMYADEREWDRAGYYNRRYQNSLIQYRRMYKSSGPQHITFTNDRI